MWKTEKIHKIQYIKKKEVHVIRMMLLTWNKKNLNAAYILCREGSTGIYMVNEETYSCQQPKTLTSASMISKRNGNTSLLELVCECFQDVRQQCKNFWVL